MFNILKKKLTVPFTILPFVSFDSDGNKVFGAGVNALCYPESKLRDVVDAKGTQVVSSTALYIDGSIVVSSQDNVIFDGVERPVQSLDGFYNKTGAVDLRVVYL